MINMHSSMMENGLDFILDAAIKLKHSEETEDETEKRKDIKYSLLHLLSGIELVMKARLYIENWTYIFSKMDNADKNKLENGDFVSIEYSKCIERLEKLCDVNISNDDKRYFEELRQSRNRVEHFYTKDSIGLIESKINKALTAIISFISNNYEEFDSPSIVDTRNEDDYNSKALKKEEKEYIDEINSVMAELQSHYKEALDLALKRVETVRTNDELFICPDCGEKTLVIADKDVEENCHCYFCGYIENAENAAEEYLSKVMRFNKYRIVKEGGEYPIYMCPDCGNDTLIKEKNKYICFSCRASYDKDELKICSECGELYTCLDDIYDDGLCKNCNEWLNEKIDKM